MILVVMQYLQLLLGVKVKENFEAEFEENNWSSLAEGKKVLISELEKWIVDIGISAVIQRPGSATQYWIRLSGYNETNNWKALHWYFTL